MSGEAEPTLPHRTEPGTRPGSGDGRRRLGVLARGAYRAYELWTRARRPRVTLGVRALVVDADGRVCLVRHTYRDGWFLPGGGVKLGETLAEGAARELREETGVVLGETPQRVLGVYSSRHGSRSDHIIVYVVTDWQVQASVSPEIAESSFFAPDELPAGTSPATLRRISEWMTGVPPGNRW